MSIPNTNYRIIFLTQKSPSLELHIEYPDVKVIYFDHNNYMTQLQMSPFDVDLLVLRQLLHNELKGVKPTNPIDGIIGEIDNLIKYRKHAN